MRTLLIRGTYMSKHVGLVAAYHFLLIFSYYIIKPLRESYFLRYLGSESLPVFNLLTIAAVVLAVVVYNAMHRCLSRLRFVLSVYIALGAFFALFAFAFHWEKALAERQLMSIVVGGFFIWLNVCNLFAVSLFWALANEFFSLSAGKRYFGLIGSGGIVGGIAAGFCETVALHYVNSREMLLLGLPFFMASGGLALLWVSKYGRSMAVAATRDEVSGVVAQEAPAPALVQELRLFAGNPYIRLIGLLVFCKVVAGTVFQWEFARVAERTLPRADLPGFYNNVFFSVNLLGLLINLAITPWMLRRCRQEANLAVLPSLVLLGSCALAWGDVTIVMACGVVLTATTYSLNKSARELLFLPTDTATKYRFKAVVDTVVYRGGTAAGSLLIIALQQLDIVRWGSFGAKILLVMVWGTAIAAVSRRFVAKVAGDVRR